MNKNPVIRVLVPALNEAENIAPLLDSIPDAVCEVIVVDNGSTDDTAAIAATNGATVLTELQRGYGRACLTGLAYIAQKGDTDVIVFLDADRCDDPGYLPVLIAPILDNGCDMVIGSRPALAQKGSLTPPQRFGNWLACFLIKLIWNTSYSDLGPFRAVTPAALKRLEMADEDFGWTVEMQIKAARLKMKTAEVQVPYVERSAGRSKISGTVNGVIRAGTKILYVIGREAIR